MVTKNQPPYGGDIVIRTSPYSGDQIATGTYTITNNSGADWVFYPGSPMRSTGVPCTAANIPTLCEAVFSSRKVVTLKDGESFQAQLLLPQSMVVLDMNNMATVDHLGAAINFDTFMARLNQLGFVARAEPTNQASAK